MDQNATQAVGIIGAFGVVVLPWLLGLRLWVRSTDFSDYKTANEKRFADIEIAMARQEAATAEHYIKKDAMLELESRLEKRFDKFDATLDTLFKLIETLRSR
jgi:hypothetical protein